MINIIEIKARSAVQDQIRKILQSRNAEFKGIDHQIDTYFKVFNGRLKLREGKLENYLVQYRRNDQSGPKLSEVLLCTIDPESNLKAILTAACGVLTIVDKKREIYFIDNVKFHIDVVEELGTFIEIEAIDEDGSKGQALLHQQCQHYLDLFQIEKNDLIAVSYSDLLLEKQRIGKVG